MTVTRSEIHEAYQDLLTQMVSVREQMLDFMALVEQLPSENPYEKTPENQLKADIINLRTSVYDKLRHFLNDSNMTVTSSDIQHSIDDLPLDEGFDCCSDCGAVFGGDDFHYCEVANNRDLEDEE